MNTMPAISGFKKIFSLTLFVLTSAIFLSTPTDGAICGELSGSLQASLYSTQASRMEVLVFFDDDNTTADSRVDLNRSGLHKFMYSNLKSKSSEIIDRFEQNIENSSLNINIKERFWITSAALVEVSTADLQKLAEIDGVSFIAPDTNLALVEPVSEAAAPFVSTSAADNLKVIGADKLWARGLTGEGRLIGSFDTGVDGDHPALADRWQGNYTVDAGQGWFDPYGSQAPVDENGHGSHVMGIMTGRNGSDTIGVAFNAHWMCASVIDRGSSLSRTISDILKAFEWAADPDGNPETIDDVPDVICHSWGIPQGIFSACDNTFWSAIDNLESLGVVCIFAAGNEGPDSMSIRQPADRASTPLNAFAVGAIDQIAAGYPVAEFSSRGPSRCDNSEIKPEVVAPGMIIRSCSKNGEYTYMSGTSMAAPHVAGAVALLRQYNPEATSEQIKSALYNSAIDLGPEGEDNAYGNGLIDLEAAIELMPEPNYPTIEIKDYSVNDGNDNIIDASETFELTLEISNQNQAVSGLWGKMYIDDSEAEIFVDSVGFGAISADGGSTNQENPFVLMINDNIVPGQAVTADIDFYDATGKLISSKRIEIIAGQQSMAHMTTLNSGEIQFTVDNFGGIGHADGSIYDSKGYGFIPADLGYNILSEFSVMFADLSTKQVSDCARYDDGFISDNDFLAVDDTLVTPGDFGSVDYFSRYTDFRAEQPIGLDISQRTSIFDDQSMKACAIIEYAISSFSLSTSDSIRLGILADWDLTGQTAGMEKYKFDSESGIMYTFNQAEDSYVGIRFLSGYDVKAVIAANPIDGKSTLTEEDKIESMTGTIDLGDTSKWGDYFGIISVSLESESTSDSLKTAVAVASAGSLEELQIIMDDAYSRYNVATAVDDNDIHDPVVPSNFNLAQNYPNPFNMATSISFELKHDAHVKIEAYNLLGQKVAVIADGYFSAGSTEINWDGKDKTGQDLASGMYLYRMVVDGQGSESRKMMILK